MKAHKHRIVATPVKIVCALMLVALVSVAGVAWAAEPAPGAQPKAAAAKTAKPPVTHQPMIAERPVSIQIVDNLKPAEPTAERKVTDRVPFTTPLTAEEWTTATATPDWLSGSP